MNNVPQIVPVSELRMKHVEVFGMLNKGPVILAQRSRPAAVLVSVAQWDAQADELARMRRILAADRQFAEVDAGKFLTQEEFDQQLAAA